ncbi:MAG: hypothetical protein ABI675_09535 [Chitinophagaceae bacterium]
MLSEELDNKMKEATEGYQPAYDDKAWDKMEALLDKHLPQEKKRRRFIVLLLPLLLVGIGISIFFILHKPGKNAVSEEKNIVIQPKSRNDQQEQGTDITMSSKTTALQQSAAPLQQGIIAPLPGENKLTEIKLQKQPVSGDINSNSRKKIKQITSRNQQFKQRQFSGEKKNDRETKDQKNNFAEQKPPEQNTLVTPNEKSSINNITAPVSIDTSASLTEIAKTDEEKEQPDSSEAKDPITKAKLQKQRSSAAGKFSINLSVGPDISSIGIDNPGKWKLQYGLGFSYAVSKKLSIRTGFFAGHKVYSADSTEYSSSYYSRLQKVDADCLVFEVPVNLIYNFPVRKKHNWFVAGGLSSYFMKREVYGYYYKDAWGQSKFSRYTYKNENSHIFSVLDISGGYQYDFSDRLSFMAEPYVRIPLSGIGAGKAKLNSGGILFTIGFKPFLKKK